MDIQSVQQLVMENKRNKGFNITDVPLELCLLQGEVGEFFQAWRRQQADTGEELADIAIYVFGLAGIIGVDLQEEVHRKIHKNAGRRYERRNGVPVRIAEADAVASPSG